MKFVKVEKNHNVAPSAAELTAAMTLSGGTTIAVTGDNKERKVEYTGDVNHTTFENNLIEIVPNARRTSWNFAWGDALASALAEVSGHGAPDAVQTARLLNAALTASEKQVTIEIDTADLDGLKKAKYRLCFAKKVGDAAYNVVWQAYDSYLVSNRFSWTPQYELFGSNTFEANVQVFVTTNKVRIGLGETSVLDTSGVLGAAFTDGPRTAFTMQNDYGPIHPGVNQISSSTMGQTRSTPIYVSEHPIVLGDTVLTPVEKILVWFQQDIQTSTMFSSSRSKAVEVDLTDTNAATRLYSGGTWSTPS